MAYEDEYYPALYQQQQRPDPRRLNELAYLQRMAPGNEELQRLYESGAYEQTPERAWWDTDAVRQLQDGLNAEKLTGMPRFRFTGDMSDPFSPMARRKLPEQYREPPPSVEDTMNNMIFNPSNVGFIAGIKHSPEVMRRAAEETEHIAKNWQEPTKTVKAYKLLRLDPKQPGKVFPLFIGKKEPIPMGEWQVAENIPTTEFSASHPGQHAGRYPTAERLMTRGKNEPRYMPQDRVWAEVELPADVDYNLEAMASKGKMIPGIPESGYYETARGLKNPNPEDYWMIGGGVKVNRIIPDDEVQQILESHGLGHAYFPRRHDEPVYDWVRDMWEKGKIDKPTGLQALMKGD